MSEQQQQQQRARGVAARMWGLTWVAYASYYMGRKGFSVSKRTLEEALGLSRADLASIDTVYLGSYALGQFVNGWLGDRVGARWLVGVGMLVSAVVCAAFGLAHATGALLFAFVVNGYAQSTGWPGTTRAMTEWTTLGNRGSVMGWWSTCYQVGGVAATALAGFLLARQGWRATFLVPAGVMAVVGVAVLAWLRSPRRSERAALEGAFAAVRSAGATASTTAAPTTTGRVDATAREGTTTAARERAATAAREGAAGHVDADAGAKTPSGEWTAEAGAPRSPLRSFELWCYGGSYFCIKLIRYSLLFWLPYFLAQSLGYEDENAAYTSLSFEVGGTLGVIVVGMGSDRVRWSRAAVSAACLCGLALALAGYRGLLFGLPPGALRDGANIVGLALIGALLFAPDSLLSGAAAQDIGGPRAAATATGFVNGVGSLGAILQGYVTACVSEAHGWGALFTVFVGLALLAVVALLPALRRKRAER